MVEIFNELEASKKTAISRNKPSVPTKLLVSKGLISGRVLDYGCGKGYDVRWLRSLGYDVYGYDPNYYPDTSVLKPNSYDTIICNYVLNVVLPDTRIEIIKNIYELLKPGGRAFISVRDKTEKINGKPYYDGVITSKGTFQKTFDYSELCRTVSTVFRYVVVISEKRPLIVMCVKNAEKNDY